MVSASFRVGSHFPSLLTIQGWSTKLTPERANIIGNPHPAGFQKNVNNWFNTAAFEQPTVGAFGDSSRNIIRGPATQNLDLSLFKSFQIERAALQFRIESFNILNQPQFGLPDPNVNDSTFGVISTINTYHPGRQNQFALKLLF